MPPIPPLGEKARWVIAFELLERAQVDEVVTYEQLAEAMKSPRPVNRHAVQQAVRAAVPRLLERHKRTVSTVINTGYRIVHPDEHYAVAERHSTKGRRSIGRGLHTLRNTDLNEVTLALRAAFVSRSEFEQRVASLMDSFGTEQKRHARRLAALEAHLGVEDPTAPPPVVDGEVVGNGD